MAGISIFNWRSLEEQEIAAAGVNLHLSIFGFRTVGENKAIYSMEVISCTGSEWNTRLSLDPMEGSLHSECFFTHGIVAIFI